MRSKRSPRICAITYRVDDTNIAVISAEHHMFRRYALIYDRASVPGPSKSCNVLRGKTELSLLIGLMMMPQIGGSRRIGLRNGLHQCTHPAYDYM